MAYWQISAGTGTREYHLDFLRYGVAFTGHNRPMKKVEVGDYLILKSGIKKAWAIGRVTSIVRDIANLLKDGNALSPLDEQLLFDFDGWQLTHLCDVEWRCMSDAARCKPEEVQEVPVSFQFAQKAIAGFDGRRLPDSMKDWNALKPIDQSPSLPETRTTSLEKIVSNIMATSKSSLNEVELKRGITAMREIAGFYYSCHWEDIREHETRTFLIVPLLRLLGWKEEQLKIEFPVPESKRRIDIACFPRFDEIRKSRKWKEDWCSLLIEAKGFAHGLRFAGNQGMDYAKSFRKCRTVIVSNGFAFRAYVRSNDEMKFQEEPSAYFNLLHMRESMNANSEGNMSLIELLLPPE